jgi:hypothetical protein
VLAVLDAPRVDALERAVGSPEREHQPVHAVAGLDDVEQALGVTGGLSGAVEILIDEVEHAACLSHADSPQELRQV